MSSKHQTVSYATAALQATKKPPDRPSTTSLPTPPPLAIPREGCLRVDCPGELSLLDVAQALEAQFKSLQGWPVVIDGHTIIQFPTDTDTSSITAIGLQIGNATAKLSPLVNSANTALVQCRISSLFHGEDGLTILKQKLAEFGEVVTVESPFYPNTSIPTGTVNVLLDLGTRTVFPPATIKLDRGTWTEQLSVHIIGKRPFCHYCRSPDHRRPSCTLAPACKKCNKHSHPTQHCPLPSLPTRSTSTSNLTHNHSPSAEPSGTYSLPSPRKRHRKGATQVPQGLFTFTSSPTPTPSGTLPAPSPTPEAGLPSTATSTQSTPIQQTELLLSPFQPLLGTPPRVSPPTRPSPGTTAPNTASTDHVATRQGGTLREMEGMELDTHE